MGQRSDVTVFGTLGLLLLAAFVVFTAPVWLRPAALPPGQPVTPAEPVNPGQPQVGAPSWVQPGTRVTWYGAAASVAGSRFSWLEDPNGNWTDPKTGKKYRRTDESGEGQGTASGDGLYQIDVIVLDGANAVLTSELFTFDRANNLLLHAPLGGRSVNGTTVDGAWVHPAELERVAQTDLGTISVLRGNYTLGNTTFDAVSFVTGLGAGGGGNYTSYTYDTQTGVLLSTNTSTAGVTSPFAAPGENPPTSNAQLTMARFAGSRQRSLPGANGATPDWVAGTRQLTYQGTYNFINPVDPSSANLTYGLEHTVQLGSGGSNWATFTSRTVVQQLAIDSQLQGVTGPTGVYWYTPAALAQMTQGQVLDQDPITGQQMAVAFVGAGANGQEVVVIDSQAPGFTLRATYEQGSGTLLAFEESARSTTGITTSLQLVDRR